MLNSAHIKGRQRRPPGKEAETYWMEHEIMWSTNGEEREDVAVAAGSIGEKEEVDADEVVTKKGINNGTCRHIWKR